MKIQQQELQRLCNILLSQPIEKIPLIELRNMISLCKKQHSGQGNSMHQISAIAQLSQQEVQRRLLTDSNNAQDVL